MTSFFVILIVAVLLAAVLGSWGWAGPTRRRRSVIDDRDVVVERPRARRVVREYREEL